ncbi:MAG: glycosyltransferase family 2 protein [Actinobacteria bacterium]|nr:glycosyltransferase family 2 protein [Actinomycetota bacterium]
MNHFDLSIIIVSYNTRSITKDCLESIVKSLSHSTFKIEIIVIDNGSIDGSIKMLNDFLNRLNKNTDSNLKFQAIFNKNNTGFGKANNQGISTAKSDYILLLNSDILVLNESINKLYEFYKQNENVINFLGGKLLNKNLTPQASCGPNYTLPMVFAHLFLRGDYYGLTRYSPNRLKKVDWISGACILTKKKYLSQLNSFDEGIFLYMEEIDLFFRAKKMGFNVYFFPGAKFIHLGSSSSKSRKYPILQVYKGLIYFYKKHYSHESQSLLKIMLKLKALVGFSIGYITGNLYLKETYEKAYKIAKMA